MHPLKFDELFIKVIFLGFYNELKFYILSRDGNMLGLSLGIKISISSKSGHITFLLSATDMANKYTTAVKTAVGNSILLRVDEIHDLTTQLSEGGRNVHETDKIRRRLEQEKEELESALEEAEAALQQEEAKTARAQLELGAIRQQIDRRIAEKEEEFESTR